MRDFVVIGFSFRPLVILCVKQVVLLWGISLAFVMLEELVCAVRLIFDGVIFGNFYLRGVGWGCLFVKVPVKWGVECLETALKTT